MLEEEEGVADEVLLAGGDDLLLNRKSFSVGYAAEMEEVDEHLEQFPKLFYGQASVFHKTAHGECIDWVITGNNENAGSVRHNDVSTLPDNLEACAFECTHAWRCCMPGSLPIRTLEHRLHEPAAHGSIPPQPIDSREWQI